MKQIEYRIMTEAMPGTDKIVAKFFDAFSINTGTGYWNGSKEGSAQIDLIIDDTPENLTKIRSLAYEIKKLNKQEAVLILRTEIQSELLH